MLAFGLASSDFQRVTYSCISVWVLKGGKNPPILSFLIWNKLDFLFMSYDKYPIGVCLCCFRIFVIEITL